MTNPPGLAGQLSEGFAGVGLATMHQAEGVQFPLWSQGVSAQGTIKVALGSLKLPILSAGQVVVPAIWSSAMLTAWWWWRWPLRHSQAGRRPRTPLGRPSCGATATAGARPSCKVGTPN